MLGMNWGMDMGNHGKRGRSPWDEILCGKDPNSVPDWVSLISERPTSHWKRGPWGSNLGLPEHTMKEKRCSYGGQFQGDCKAIALARQPWGAAGVRGDVLGPSIMDLHTPGNVTGSDPGTLLRMLGSSECFQ